MGDLEQYATFFTGGYKVTVCIPMDNNEIFRDWGTVQSLEKDILTLQLSRNEYPKMVHLVEGIVLDLRIGVKDTGYRCNGRVVDIERAGIVRLMLSGDVTASEPREYYRIDVFIPFRYEFSQEQSIEVLIGRWRKRRQLKFTTATERRATLIETHRAGLRRTAMDGFSPGERGLLSKFQQNPLAYSDVDESWNNVNAYAVNLSAGGFKFVTADDFDVDELVFFDLYIPGDPPRVVDTVARVIYKKINDSIKEEKKYFDIAVHFSLIDDRGRDAIVSHIFKMEALRIRQKRQLPVYKSQRVKTKMTPLKKALYVLLSVASILFISYFYYAYSTNKTSNEIEDIFREAIRQHTIKRGGQPPRP